MKNAPSGIMAKDLKFLPIGNKILHIKFKSFAKIREKKRDSGPRKCQFLPFAGSFLVTVSQSQYYGSYGRSILSF